MTEPKDMDLPCSTISPEFYQRLVFNEWYGPHATPTEDLKKFWDEQNRVAKTCFKAGWNAAHKFGDMIDAQREAVDKENMPTSSDADNPGKEAS